MAVTPFWKKLDTSDVYQGIEIASRFAKNLYQSLNALYESLWDATAPGAASQVYAGHDHNDEGGGPLICNSQLTADAAYYYIKQASSVSVGDLSSFFIGPFYVSPGIAHAGLMIQAEAQVCCTVTGGDFKIRLNMGEALEVKSTGTGVETTNWIKLLCPLTRGKTWDWLWVHTECTRADDDDGDAEIKIHSINLAETYKSSQPQSLGMLGAGDISRGINGLFTILRYFDTLDDEVVQKWEWLDAYVAKTLWSALNYVYEGINDLGAPGASDQYIQGHDHYSSGYGGREIPRGKVFSTIQDEEYGWCQSASLTAGLYYYADSGNAQRRTSGGTGISVLTSSPTPIFKAWIDEGITSGSSFPTVAAPYLDAWVKVRASAYTASISVWIYNQTAADSASSGGFTADTGYQWIRITKVPCVGGQWNEFDLQVISSTSSRVVYIDGIVLTEAYEYSDTKMAYVASSGDRILGTFRDGEALADES